MKYTLENGKQVNIPDADLIHLKTKYNLTDEKAIETWLVDEGYLEDEVVEELSNKAKKNRITATIHQAKATETKAKQPKPKKEDPEKEMIIKELASFLPNFAEKVTILNETKVIEFTIGENLYKLDLIKHRKSK